MITIDLPVALAAALLWTGFVSAISFLEAPLKFRAPGISVELGLGIGRLVFRALNRAEWIFALAIAANILIAGGYPSTLSLVSITTAYILLAVQTTWALPALSRKADLHIRTGRSATVALHRAYIVMEISKLLALILFSISLFKPI